MTPEQVARMQGPTAINQWKFPGMFNAKPVTAPAAAGWNMPNPADNARIAAQYGGIQSPGYGKDWSKEDAALAQHVQSPNFGQDFTADDNRLAQQIAGEPSVHPLVALAQQILTKPKKPTTGFSFGPTGYPKL